MHTIVHLCTVMYTYTCMYSKGERDSRVSFWLVIHCVIYYTGEWKDKVSPILFK